MLCLFSCFGVESRADALICEPLLREEETALSVNIKAVGCEYSIKVSKPEGFRRTRSGAKIKVDGKEIDSFKVPQFADGKLHEVEVDFS